MGNSKKISEWIHILLDTSFIIDYLSSPEKFDDNPKKKESITLANDIMSELSLVNRVHKPQFYITSITIGELIKLETASISRKIVEIFYSGDVTFLPYGKSEAEEMNEFIQKYRKLKEPWKSLQAIEKAKKESECMNYRGWINDDMKILSCAKKLHDKKMLDVILTSDEKTFLPIAEIWKLPCRCLNSTYFPRDMYGELKEQ
ncbi:MAG: hypothetical protein LBQ78_04330 [Tannerellaceae bacterium]|jgi:hypothetical protein|nr:hypothetical protein [Tannerellaceae bacterium]